MERNTTEMAPSGATGTAAGSGGRTIYQEDIVRSGPARYALAFGRICLGWYFLWAFLDKLFGLGYATPTERSWLNGGTPAQGFMANAEGPFAGIFHGMGQTFGAFSDWLFMAGLLGLGVALITGCGLRIAAVTGGVLLGCMWLATYPTAGDSNPFMTSHWIELAVLLSAATTLAGDTLGRGRWWGRTVGNSWLR